MDKNISVKLKGGLGNFMFQISAAYSYSLEYKKELLININDVYSVHKNVSHYYDNIFSKLEFTTSFKPCDENFFEPFFSYQKIPFFDGSVCIDGYFQSEKYFINHKNQVLDLFEIDKKTKRKLLEIYGGILNEDTCSIHVRRGDYMGLQNHHPVQTIDYYKNATKVIGEDKHFLIFSDDIKWCEENFNFLKNKTFILGNLDYEDLYLMSMCKDNIIANSTFSWWGSWLNKNKNKQVIIPSKWFGISNLHLNTNDLYCDKWIKL